MKDLILMKNNLNVEIIKEKNFKYEKDIDYVVIPLNSYDIENGFIIVEANKYMEFDYCDIRVKMSNVMYEHYNNEDPIEIGIMENMAVRLNSLIDLYNYIHSFSKIEFINTILEGNLDNDIIVGFDIMNFDIRLYKNDKIIFEYYYNKFGDKNNSFSEYNYFEVNFSKIFKCWNWYLKS